MTKEQMKSLKKGDKFAVEYTVSKHEDGKVHIKFANGNSDGVWLHNDELLTQATLVTPPPTFEVGDTVRIVPDPLTGTVYGNGYSYAEWVEQKASIHKKKMRTAEMQVALSNGLIIIVNIHCLELVKKAPKDKYAVRKCYVGGGWTSCKVVTLGHEYTVAEFLCSLHPDAQAAAEAECARLNAEWRKKQEGGAE